jgi:S1-C subfamily serine protease
MHTLRRSSLAALGLGAALVFLAGPVRAQTELEQQVAVSLAETFRQVARESVPRTVCFEMKVGEKRGFGSGAIISADGLVLTCAHVVEVSSDIRAITSDGTVHRASVLGRNSTNDYALVKIEGGPFPSFPMGDSSKLKMGDWVMALGHPGGPYADRHPAFAVGRVTGLHKRLPIQLNAKYYDDAVQTNVPIFAGNSGGPLVNLHGELVGINGAIMMVNENAYAVPINEIRADLPAFRAGRDVKGRPVENYSEVLRDLQKEINPGDLEKMFGKGPFGKGLGEFFKRFMGGAPEGAPRRRRPTRNDFLVRYFRPLQSRVGPSVVEVLAGGKRVGYGVIVDSAGYVLTNARIVGVGRHEVRVPGRGVFPAEITGSHGPLDVALLRLQGAPPRLPAAPIARDGSLRPGDWLVTASPGGEHPLAVGVVSAVGRSIGTSRKIPTMGLFGMFGTPNESPLRPYEAVVHHDSKIVDGVFGSPVFNVSGELVGINVANFYPGSSYATPAGEIEKVLEKLRTGLHVAPPRTYGTEVQTSPFGGGTDLFKDFFEQMQKMFKDGNFDLEDLFKGDGLQKMLERLFKGFGEPKTDGVKVATVVEGGGAAGAGIRPGDVLVQVAGKKVLNLEALRGVLAGLRPGQTVEVVLVRGARRLTVSMTLGDREGRAYMGITVEQR